MGIELLLQTGQNNQLRYFCFVHTNHYYISGL